MHTYTYTTALAGHCYLSVHWPVTEWSCIRFMCNFMLPFCENTRWQIGHVVSPRCIPRCAKYVDEEKNCLPHTSHRLPGYQPPSETHIQASVLARTYHLLFSAIPSGGGWRLVTRSIFHQKVRKPQRMPHCPKFVMQNLIPLRRTSRILLRKSLIGSGCTNLLHWVGSTLAILHGRRHHCGHVEV